MARTTTCRGHGRSACRRSGLAQEGMGIARSDRPWLRASMVDVPRKRAPMTRANGLLISTAARLQSPPIGSSSARTRRSTCSGSARAAGPSQTLQAASMRCSAGAPRRGAAAGRFRKQQLRGERQLLPPLLIFLALSLSSERAVVLPLPLHCRDSVDVNLSFRPVERNPCRIDNSFLTS